MAGPGQAQTQNTVIFEAYFQRADLDRDGRISGAEAVAFFQGSNLPKPVLAQIWTYADHNKAGFLGRQEFYNALKLVTVAQSKRELTPDMVKAALHGPASAKIPAPQINLAALTGPQSNVRGGSPVPPLSSTTSALHQSTSVQGPQGLPSQQSQFMRPPMPPATSTVLQSQKVVASQGMPQGGTMAAPLPSSSDWRGGRTSSSPSGATSQFPDRGIGSMPGVVASGSAPSTQPRPQSTTLLTKPVSSKPNDATPSNQVAAKDSKALSAIGNGFASDSLFGNVFPQNSSQPKQASVGLASSVSSLPVSSAIVSASVGPQSAVKPGPLNPVQSSSTRQPLGIQHPQIKSLAKPNQHMQTSSAFPVGTGNVVSGQSQIPWPRMTQSDFQKYSKVFFQVDTDRDGKITGVQARNLFLSWRLPREILKQVWDLSDQDNDGMLSLREFCFALYLIERSREGRPLPSVLPTTILDETLFPSSATMYGNASWRPTGFQQQQVTKSARPVTSVGGGKPPRPPQLEEPKPPSQPKPKVPVLEKHLVEQLSTEEQNMLNSKFQEATDAEKKVAELEMEILDAKEKIQFYYAKTQELILYKSRCDNRLNEISERVSADKREVESLAKKYEEKYKQAGDVASKLTIEEATFRDIQDKKMELYRAVVKLDQDGSADKIQDNGSRIQLSLEELVKSLNERCKAYGLRGKPTSLLELPFGWQPGIQEGAADWDEDWDKFEDEGFTFVKELTLDVQNFIAPPKPKTALIREKAPSTYDSNIAESSSNGNVKVEHLPDDEKRIPEGELANTQSNEQKAGSSPDSPARQNAVENPSKEFQDSQSRKDVSFDGSPRTTQSEREGAESVPSGDKAFDEPVWGTFDTQYDTDATWDFNAISSKDEDHGRHGENSFFGPDDWGLNPIKTGTTRENSYSKQTPFFDSVPSTPNTYVKPSPFFDSVPSTPNTYAEPSPFFDSVPSTPNTYAKPSSFFDSVPSTPNTYAKPSPFFDSVPSSPLYNSGSSPLADDMFQRKSPFSFADSVPSTPMFSGEGTQEHSFDAFSRFDSFNLHDSGPFAPRESLTRFDSMRSTGDSDYDQGFPSTRESMARFDSFRSTADSEYNHGIFPPQESFTRFDSIRSTKDSDHGYGFSSFDDGDPFGSSEPFKTSVESQTQRKDSDSWKAF